MRSPDLTAIDHRPWPVPSTAWTWQQEWYDLLFAHWPIEVSELRALVPPELEIDTHSGAAWIGVVPFRMRIKRRGMPGVPTASHFAELNVRTYVKLDGKPGVWFFSLDAESRLAVWGAKRFFHLPYYHAAMQTKQQGDWIDYVSTRRGVADARFAGRYRPIGPVAFAMKSSLEHWLTERYCLFARSKRGAYWCGEIHHSPWPLQRAEAEIRENTMLAPLGLATSDADPVLHFAKSIDVALWPLQKVTVL
ncbi:YqjF family protein [Aeoliella sp. SH292]|uniref:YqjF family protein n=1 Tax=Aeoliella sp. SH292 TaxID=3454464 RepID=UPI003F98C9BA